LLLDSEVATKYNFENDISDLKFIMNLGTGAIKEAATKKANS